MTKPGPNSPWRVPVAVHEVPETGRHFDLTADEATRTAVAKLAGLRSVSRLDATFDVARHGRDGLQVTGRVSATVGQVCGVTLEPIDNEIEEPVDVIFAPGAAPVIVEDEEGPKVDMATDATPELLVHGVVDLGAVATEFLLLGIDPYPRKAGAVFEPPPAGDDTAHPFAALAALKKRGKRA